MKQTITIDSLNQVTGKWIIQLCNNQENVDITKSENPEFWLEKRISFIGRLYNSDGYPHIKFENGKGEFIIMNGVYYCHGVYTREEFVEYFNNGYESRKERFHRLLTSKELDWLNEHLKKNNY